jgi:trk system potassium uptake protein
MNIIVVGCGRVGAELAFRLYNKGQVVTVVDPDPEAFRNMHPEFRGRTLEGDPLHRDVLLRAGIEHAGGLAAVTRSDAVNAVVAHVARTVFKVENVVVRNYEPRWNILEEAFGLPIVSPSSWGAQRIEEQLTTGIHSVFSAGSGEVEVYEIVVKDSFAGRPLKELFGEGQCQAVAVSRGGHAVMPDCDMVLQAGDVVNLSATDEGIQQIRRLVSGQEA